MERRNDGERLAKLETTTDWLKQSYKDMDGKLDTIVGGITELKTARQIESQARTERRIPKAIWEAAKLVAAAISGAGGGVVVNKAQAVVEQVTPHVR